MGAILSQQPEVVRKNCWSIKNNRCIIPNNQEDILYKALREVIADPDRREKGIELTYEMIQNHFTWKIVAKQVERICEEK